MSPRCARCPGRMLKPCIAAFCYFERPERCAASGRNQGKFPDEEKSRVRPPEESSRTRRCAQAADGRGRRAIHASSAKIALSEDKFASPPGVKLMICFIRI